MEPGGKKISQRVRNALELYSERRSESEWLTFGEKIGGLTRHDGSAAGGRILGYEAHVNRLGEDASTW